MQIVTTDTNRTSTNWIALGGLVLGLGAALVAQFSIDSLADSSQLWHWLQHGALFAGGILAGCSLLTLYRAGQRQV